jgi:hypothetical protein
VRDKATRVVECPGAQPDLVRRVAKFFGAAWFDQESRFRESKSTSTVVLSSSSLDARSNVARVVTEVDTGGLYAPRFPRPQRPGVLRSSSKQRDGDYG